MTIRELANKLGYYIEGDDISSGTDLLNTIVETAEKEYERGRTEGAAEEKERIRGTIANADGSKEKK